jgi:multiple antibiotic resistance protein
MWQRERLTIAVNRLHLRIATSSRAIISPEPSLVEFFNAFANLLQREFTSSDLFEHLLKSSIALFVVLNPIGTVPLFIAIMQNMKKEERKAVSKTIITSGTVLIVFAIGGTAILSIFGITVFSFMIAGGVLLFIVAIELLTHGVWRFGDSTLPGESGVVPLAFSLLAGPGAITVICHCDNLF